MTIKNRSRYSFIGGLLALLTLTNASESKALSVRVNLPGSPGSKDQWGTCFQSATAKWKVPEQLLRAIANMESGGFHNIPEHHRGLKKSDHPEFYGVMALRNDPTLGFTLREAAILLRKDLHEIERSPCLNIEGAAAVLAKHFKGKNRSDFAGYISSLEHYWNFKNPADARSSIKDLQRHLKKGSPLGRVFLRSSPKLALRLGGAFSRRMKGQGMATIDAAKAFDRVRGGGAEYSGAEWNPSPNFSSGNEDKYIVVHTTEGGFSGSSAWLRNPSSGVSAHYIVRKDDGYVEQLVSESDSAHHARCWNGQAIGIETEGHSGDSDNWTETLYDAVARLTSYLSTKHGIPADRLHIIGHNFGQSGMIDQTDLENCNDHSDPGQYFDWSHFMGMIGGGYDNGGGYGNGNGNGGNDNGNGDYNDPPPSRKPPGRNPPGRNPPPNRKPPGKTPPPSQDDGSGDNGNGNEGDNGNGNDGENGNGNEEDPDSDNDSDQQDDEGDNGNGNEDDSSDEE